MVKVERSPKIEHRVLQFKIRVIDLDIYIFNNIIRVKFAGSPLAPLNATANQ